MSRINAGGSRFLTGIIMLICLLLIMPRAVSSETGAVADLPDSTLELIAPGGSNIRHLVDSNHNRISGDGGSLLTGDETTLSALVLTETGEAAVGVEVSFDQVAPQAENLGTVLTDNHGIAMISFQGGSKSGPYTVIAKIKGGGDQDHIVYQLSVRKSSWVMFMIFGLLGGLGLFLFGMDMMSSSMQRSAGGRMRAILGALTKNRLIGLGVGAFVTMIIQSSSATTVMLVSFVQAQLMTFAQTMGVILGADIGTTITAQLIAFKLTDYALLMIALGFALKILPKRQSLRNAGEVLLGFGILFFGMHIMSKAMYPLRSYRPFLDMLQGLENPILGILVGAVFTALIQSSSAFTGIIIVLAQQGFLSLDAGIPLIFGANLGTCVTAGLASLNTGRAAKRVALAHTGFKVAGILLMVWWIPWLADFVRSISPGGDIAPGDTVAMAKVIPRQIANAHTVFNVGLALVFLPFTGLFAALIIRILPDVVEDESLEYEARHLEKGLLNTPSLALNLAKVEILRIGRRVSEMVEKIIIPFFSRDIAVCENLHEMEKEVDALDAQVTAYLIEITKRDLNDQQAEEVYMMLHVTKQLELVADIIDEELRPLALEKMADGVDFSSVGTEEVKAYHLKVIKQINRSLKAFEEGSLEKAQRVTRKQKKYVALEGSFRRTHFERISMAVKESVETSRIHIALMDSLRKVNSHSADIARAMLAQFEAVADGAEDEEQSEDPVG
jgi:phosphate:Na+ symporter